MTTNETKTELLTALDALAKAEERADLLLMEADTDELTGLMNRRGLARRTGSRDWGWYVAADLDGFKVAQDADLRGHAYGDEVLIEFADFIMMNTRQRDMRARDLLAARTGGDEFTVWTETRAGARRIKEAIREWASKDGKVRASAGMGKDQESADGACYSDKLTRKANR
jgi:diguanylate cyclase (GGDEF)-like protein